MEYRHITTGVIVNSEKELPPSIYEKVAAEPQADKPAKKSAKPRKKEQ